MQKPGVYFGGASPDSANKLTANSKYIETAEELLDGHHTV